MSDGFIKACMQTKGQTITGCVDVINQAIHVITLVPHHMQNRAKHFAFQITEAINLNDCRRYESALLCSRSKRKLLNLATHIAHRLNVRFDNVLGFLRDNCTDINLELVGTANGKLLKRTLEHRQNAVGDIFLQTKHTQRRATLTGAVESRANHVEHDLLGESGRIHDHCVLATCFSDQRDRLAIWQQTRSKLRLNEACNFGRAGEHYATGFLRCNKCCTDAAIARQKLQCISRNASFVQNANALRCYEWGFLSRLCQNRIARNKSGCNLSGKDCQREVPRADANNGTERLVSNAQCAAGLFCIVTQEVNSFAHFCNRIWH